MSWKPGLLTWMHLKLWLTFLRGWTHPFHSHVCNHSICILTFKILWCLRQHSPKPSTELYRSNSHPLHQQHLILTAATLPMASKEEKTAQKSSWLTPFNFINQFCSLWSCSVRARCKKAAQKAQNIIQLSSLSGHSPDMPSLLFHMEITSFSFIRDSKQGGDFSLFVDGVVSFFIIFLILYFSPFSPAISRGQEKKSKQKENYCDSCPSKLAVKAKICACL